MHVDVVRTSESTLTSDVLWQGVFVFEEAAILETHGIDVQSPGGHSNSDEIDGNDFSEPGAEPGLGTVRNLTHTFNT